MKKKKKLTTEQKLKVKNKELEERVKWLEERNENQYETIKEKGEKIDEYEKKEEERETGIRTIRSIKEEAKDNEIRFLKHIIRVYAKDPTLESPQQILKGIKNGEIDQYSIEKIIQEFKF